MNAMSSNPQSSRDSPFVADVSRDAFTVQVVERSHKTPVLVDFWAPWCGPCRMLTPVLDKLAGDYRGKMFLAKVNTDVEQELATQYQIRGIPAVKLFRNGQVAGEFVGVQPESAVRALIDRFIPSETDAVVDQASVLAHEGKVAEAIALLRPAIERDARNDRAKIELARLLLSPLPTGDPPATRVEAVQKLLDSLSVRIGAEPDVEALRARLDLARIVLDAPPLEELARTVAANAGDPQARYQLAARLALEGKYEPAMAQLLEIVQRDRKFKDDAARKALIAMFNVIGGRDPLVMKYRAILARAIN
jgi:putative thioredoxin